MHFCLYSTFQVYIHYFDNLEIFWDRHSTINMTHLFYFFILYIPKTVFLSIIFPVDDTPLIVKEKCGVNNRLKVFYSHKGDSTSIYYIMKTSSLSFCRQIFTYSDQLKWFNFVCLASSRLLPSLNIDKKTEVCQC